MKSKWIAAAGLAVFLAAAVVAPSADASRGGGGGGNPPHSPYAGTGTIEAVGDGFYVGTAEWVDSVLVPGEVSGSIELTISEAAVDATTNYVVAAANIDLPTDFVLDPELTLVTAYCDETEQTQASISVSDHTITVKGLSCDPASGAELVVTVDVVGEYWGEEMLVWVPATSQYRTDGNRKSKETAWVISDEITNTLGMPE